MNRKFKMSLNKVPTVPSALRIDGTQNIPRDFIDVNLYEVWHHMFIDTYGELPQGTNSSYQLYRQFITNDDFFRFRRNALTSHSEASVGEYNKWGKALCRYSLYKYFNITYFAHLSDYLNKNIHPGFGDIQIKQSSPGDTPDYLCAENVITPIFAEAKGRQGSINFTNKEFDNWRDQVNRVCVFNNRTCKSSKLKSFIVASRLVSQKYTSRTLSEILIEDPEGDDSINKENIIELCKSIISAHYSMIFERLSLPLFSQVLRGNFTIERGEAFITLPVWKCLVPPLKDKLFVGGYYDNYDIGTDRSCFYFDRDSLNSLNFLRRNRFFFGLELGVFKRVMDCVYSGRDHFMDFKTFDYNKELSMPKGASFLRDGSLIAPIDYMLHHGYEEC